MKNFSNKIVSIIIPTRNRSNILNECLKGIMNQNFPYKMEIIIVDDFSQDDTQKVVFYWKKKFEDKKIKLNYVRNSSSKGANFSRNIGIKIANGEIIVFVDDDILPPPNWLHNLIKNLENDRKLCTTGPVILKTWKNSIGKHGEGASLVTHVTRPVKEFNKIVPIASNMASYKEIFENNLFDPMLHPPVEEIDWLLRSNIEVKFVPEAFVFHNKKINDLKFNKLVRLAWKRGSETGWWYRVKIKMSFKEKIKMSFTMLSTIFRSLGHAIIKECIGGVLISLSEFAKLLALFGLLKFKNRKIKSWK